MFLEPYPLRKFEENTELFLRLYKGQTKDGKLHGIGIFIAVFAQKPQNFNLYMGQFKDGLYHGYGRILTQDLEKDGQWKFG